MFHHRHITAIVPAHNEEPAIAQVLTALSALKLESGSTPVIDQIIVCDNASTDKTGAIARDLGCTVVEEAAAGYGAACQAALATLNNPDIIVFVDADRSVVVEELPRLLHPVLNGADLVIGSRVLGSCEPGSMTMPQRFGNALAALLIRLLWRQTTTDLGPFRAITRQALDQLDMQDRRFGWTVEMQIRGIQEGLHIVEVAVTSVRRIGRSKISGTLCGVLAAGKDILGTVFRLYIAQQRIATAKYFAVR